MPLSELDPLFTVAATLAGAAVMIVWRLRETSTPVSTRKIVAPPLGMSTGLSMFLLPAARVPWTWAAAAFLLGALVLSIPLARTSTLVRKGGVVLVQRSRAFLWILLGLVAARLALRGVVGQVLSPIQTGALLFLVALGTVLRWRAGMLIAFVRLRAAPLRERAGDLAA